MVLNKDKVRQSIFDVVPRAAEKAKARDQEEARAAAEPAQPAPTAPPPPAAPPVDPEMTINYVPPPVPAEQATLFEKASGLIGEVDRTPPPATPEPVVEETAAPAGAAQPEPVVEAPPVEASRPAASEISDATAEFAGEVSEAPEVPAATEAPQEASATRPAHAESVGSDLARPEPAAEAPPSLESIAVAAAEVAEPAEIAPEPAATAAEPEATAAGPEAAEPEKPAAEPEAPPSPARDAAARGARDPGFAGRDAGGDAWRGVSPGMNRGPFVPRGAPPQEPARDPSAPAEDPDGLSISGMLGERPMPPEPSFLEADPAGTAYAETPIGFAHVIRRYLTGDFFAQFIRLFIVCKMCQHRLESSGNFLSCPGCKHRIDSKDLAVHVLRFVGEELYARERVGKELEWLEAPKLNLRGTVKKNVGEDLARVLSEAHVCMFAHELVKTAVHKSPGTLLEFFRKYIDRIEIGKGDIKIHIR